LGDNDLKIYLLTSVFIFQFSLQAQHFITFGMGLGRTYYSSNDLTTFTETYNAVNAPNLATSFNGIGNATGIHWEFGYRYYRSITTAFFVGIQNYAKKDAAKFGNGEIRELNFTTNSFFIEYDLGRSFNKMFICGLFGIYYRNLKIESKYYRLTGQDPPASLTGVYKSNGSLSTDIGITAGFFRFPAILAVKISYPIYVGGGSKVLRDNNETKIADGLDKLPDDYLAYVSREAYAGVKSDIDGLKVAIKIALALRFKK
jgi:hypothetical protein